MRLKIAFITAVILLVTAKVGLMTERVEMNSTNSTDWRQSR